MAIKKRYILWAGIFLLLLTFLSLDAIYWLLFFIWRSAAETALNGLWLPRIYIWLAVFTISVIAWISLLIWIIRQGHQSAKPLSE
jgi:hypothetical protein